MARAILVILTIYQLPICHVFELRTYVCDTTTFGRRLSLTKAFKVVECKVHGQSWLHKALGQVSHSLTIMQDLENK